MVIIIGNVFQAGGLVLGMKKVGSKEKIYIVDKDYHSLVIGATRSGKSRHLVIPTICTLGLAGESMIVSDPKGELYQYTYPFLFRLGYDVYAVDFRNPLKSHEYNFLQPVIDAVDNDDIAAAVEATWDITSILVGEPKGERIWRDGEASTIAASIMSVVYDNRIGEFRKYQNMTNVYYFIAKMCRTENKSMPIVRYMKSLDDNHPSKGLIAISEIAPEKTRGSFFTAALTTLRLFTSPTIYAMTRQSCYRPKDLGNGKVAVFIILPDEKTTYYSLASLFVSQHYEQLVKEADERGGRLKNRVNFILDEFGNFTQISDFSTKLTIAGGRGMRFNLFLQGFSQLEEKYGKEVARTIRGNCEYWIYLRANDNETAEEISKKLGNYTIVSYSQSSSYGKYSSHNSSQSINLTGRPLLTPDEIGRIKRPYSLVLSNSYPAIMYAPDLSEYSFNKMLGLGDVEHNIKVRDIRESNRKVKKVCMEEIELWGIWNNYDNYDFYY